MDKNRIYWSTKDEIKSFQEIVDNCYRVGKTEALKIIKLYRKAMYHRKDFGHINKYELFEYVNRKFRAALSETV